MDIPAKHRGLIDPTRLLDSDVAHARGARIKAGGGCCCSTGGRMAVCYRSEQLWSPLLHRDYSNPFIRLNPAFLQHS